MASGKSTPEPKLAPTPTRGSTPTGSSAAAKSESVKLKRLEAALQVGVAFGLHRDQLLPFLRISILFIFQS